MIKHFNLFPGRLDKIALIIPVLFFSIYCLFPVEVSSIDGYGFAFMIKNGEDLFLSHHLLYNFIGFLWFNVICWFGDFDVIAGLKIMNSFAAGISLFLLNKIFKKLEVLSLNRVLWLFFVGSSWGLMRFATENETYILPICFSLFGSFCFLKYLSDRNRIFLLYAGVFTAFAALIHQIHFFWWLGIFSVIFLRKKYLRDSVFFLIPALIVPLAYLIVFVCVQNNSFSFVKFIQFIFNDYHSGAAEFSVDLRNVLLTPASFIRTFVQVHGYMFHLVMKNMIFSVVLLFSLVFFSKSIIVLKNVGVLEVKVKSIFFLAHIFAFVFQLIFAFFSHGNAEFMIMLPFLMAIVFSGVFINYTQFLFYLSMGIFLWNISFGLIPMSSQDVNGDKMVVDFILSKPRQNDEDLFLLFNRPRVANMVEYYNDSLNRKNLIFIDEFQNEDEVIGFLNTRLSSGHTIYTDCFDRPFTLSRASILVDSNYEAFERFQKEKIDSVSSLSGTYYLTQISYCQE